MKRFVKAILPLLLAVLILPVSSNAETKQAEEISSQKLVVQQENMPNPYWLFDGNFLNAQTGNPNMSLTLSSERGIGSLYLIFDKVPGTYTVRSEDSGKTVLCGQNDFLHEYVDFQAGLGEVPTSVTILFGEKAPSLNEIRAFTEGEPPADVQRWKLAPQEGVDLMLFPAHGDDEQLFFAGVLPYYAGELQYEVQVAYSTDHSNYGTRRPHEMLDGLWAVGVTNYPVFGPFPDYFSKSEDAAVGGIAQKGYEREHVLEFVVEQLRRFKPLVAVGHDLNGEYGHGSHRLYGKILTEAVELSGNPAKFPESAQKYGIWDVPKTYIHLYPENPIHMNWDIPLDHFGGKTAYEVCKDIGFPAHVSQYEGFVHYFTGHDTAEDIQEHSPCDYGLYRSLVGQDVQKNDFFENLLNRKDQKTLEIQKREEEAQKRKAERRRLEEEKKQKEAEKAEADRKADQEKARQADEAMQLYMEQVNHRQKTVKLVIGAGILVVLLGIAVLIVVKIRK